MTNIASRRLVLAVFLLGQSSPALAQLKGAVRVRVPVYRLPALTKPVGRGAAAAAPAAPRLPDDGEFPMPPEPAAAAAPVAPELSIKLAEQASFEVSRDGELSLELEDQGDKLFDMAPERVAAQLPSIAAAVQAALDRPAKGKAALVKAARAELKRLSAEKRVPAAAGSPVEGDLRLEPEMDAVLKGMKELVNLAVGRAPTAADFKATMAGLLSGYTTALLAAAGAAPAGRPIVNDVTRLNPVAVERVVEVETLEEIQAAVRANPVVSVGGGRYSMGGQTATPGGVQIDMRKFNKVLEYKPAEKEITVQAGARWRDLQELVDKDDLSVKIMQSYANFTVGGSLGVNSHGRYMGLGPLILSVKAIKLVLADGSVVEATPAKNADYFYAAIGGYGGVGVVAEATLSLAENRKLERVVVEMPKEEYPAYFQKNIRDAAGVVFHNADIVPPYDVIRSISYVETDKPVTVKERLMPRGKSYRLDRLMIHLITERPWGGLYRRLADKLSDFGTRVVWRNHEASYDVASLEPKSREKSTYVLQEYFIPVDRINEFSPKGIEILDRHGVNLLNVSLRHARKDPGSKLAWAPEEVFAFVLYYKQGTSEAEKGQVAVWTRELIDAAVASGGTYYLPYQVHGRKDQFHAAYKGAEDYFAFKRRVDPANKFRNTLLDAYYEQAKPEAAVAVEAGSFARVFGSTRLRDGFFRFLQIVFNLFPEARFHRLIAEETAKGGGDEAVYKRVQARLKEVSPVGRLFRYILPSLTTQKAEMLAEMKQLLGKDFGPIDGYVEVGYPGRHIEDFRKKLGLKGPAWVVAETEPGYSPADVAERGGLRKKFIFVENNYEPIAPEQIPDASADLVTIFIGLHHAPQEKLAPYLASLRRILRPGGRLVIREHDVDSPEQADMTHLAHIVYDLGIGVPWDRHAKDARVFTSRKELGAIVEAAGFRDTGKSILQANDPSKNTLMEFVRQPDIPEPGPRYNFARVYGDAAARENFGKFMDVVYGFFPEGKLHALIGEETAKGGDDEAIYRRVQARLKEITPFLKMARYDLKAAAKQKQEIGDQMAALLGPDAKLDGMLEYGSEGLYTNALRERVPVTGKLYTVDLNPPSYSPKSVVTRGQLFKLGPNLTNLEEPITPEQIPDASLDLLVVDIGLHHLDRPKLDAYVASLWRVLRPGGRMILRDHDVDSELMKANAHLAHDVFNLGFSMPWTYNAKEYRKFFSADELAGYLATKGFVETGATRLLQAGDPSKNTLMLFQKADRPGEPAFLASQNRAPEATYLTMPEWNIVFASRDYAAWLRKGYPSEYPYLGAVAEYWREARYAARHSPRFNAGLYGMLAFIGVAHSLEFGLKGLYERTLGRAAESVAAGPQDLYAAKVAQDYVDFIAHTPWYSFDYLGALRGLWAIPTERGARLRGWERRGILSLEYGVKAVYAAFTKKLTAAVYSPEELSTFVVAEKASGETVVLKLPRYAAFQPPLEALIASGARIRSIAGNTEIALTVLAPKGWAPFPPHATTLHRYPQLTVEGRERVAVKANVAKLHELLPSIARSGAVLEHVYDF